MAQLILNNNDYAVDFRGKINDNFTELFNNNVPTNHASTNDIYGLGTASLYGHLRVAAGNGLVLNTGTISLTQATTAAFGAVKLASTVNGTSSTDVITSALLNNRLGTTATTGSGSIPCIYYGTSDPASSLGNKDGDLYVKYV